MLRAPRFTAVAHDWTVYPPAASSKASGVKSGEGVAVAGLVSVVVDTMVLLAIAMAVLVVVAVSVKVEVLVYTLVVLERLTVVLLVWVIVLVVVAPAHFRHCTKSSRWCRR